MDNFRKKFVEEALDLLTDLESTLLKVNTEAGDMSIIEHIFRIMHTLKGNSAMFGFQMIDQYTHQLETIYDLIRNGKKELSQDLLDLTLESVDHIRSLLDEENMSKAEVQANHKNLLQRINLIVAGDVKQEKAISATTKEESNTCTYYILFQPHQGILSNGTNPLYLVEDFKALGDCLVFPNLELIPEFEELNPELCYVTWEMILATRENPERIHEVLIFAEDSCNLDVQKISDTNLIANTAFCNRVNKEGAAGKGIGLQKIKECFNERQTPPKKQEISDSRSINEVTNKLKSISSIRVSSEKLDELINLVSELVTTQAGLSLAAAKINSKDLHVLAEDVEKLTRRLRDSTFEIRLIPIENMITRFHRLVRELSHELKKDIAFITEGTDIELDKNMIEGLIDPIMHIIRNCIDHGIESIAERKSTGKKEQGTITFKAYHSGSNVYIQINDDGKGIDPEKIRQKAIQKGIIGAEAVLSKREILDLIFLPGFSTSENITNISGRGVGMDVVKRKISDLRGEVSIETEPGKGTSIILKLPLTLSIIDGLLVAIDNAYFVIPLASIHKCFEFRHEMLLSAVNNLIFVNDGHIPFIYLRSEFGIDTAPPDVEQVVVIEYGEGRIGLTVDKVIGEYQAVLKSLGHMYKKQDIISGATILGDGTVALVLDPNKIITQFSYLNQKVLN